MDQAESVAMDLGNRLESAVLDYAEEQLGPLRRNVEKASQTIPYIVSNLDAEVIETENPVEAKTSGILWKPDPNWGDDGSSDVPDYIAVQAYIQMFCSERGICFIPALIGGRGMSMFTVERDEDTMKLILEHCQRFWEGNVLKVIPPSDSDPSLDVVKRIQREPGVVVTISDELVQRWIEAKEAFSIAEDAKEAAQAVVIASLGSAEDGKCSLGEIKYHSQHKDSYVSKACDYRVLRLSKPKKK